MKSFPAKINVVLLSALALSSPSWSGDDSNDQDPEVMSATPSAPGQAAPTGTKEAYKQEKGVAKAQHRSTKDDLKTQRKSGNLSKQDYKSQKKDSKQQYKDQKSASKEQYKPRSGPASTVDDQSPDVMSAIPATPSQAPSTGTRDAYKQQKNEAKSQHRSTKDDLKTQRKSGTLSKQDYKSQKKESKQRYKDQKRSGTQQSVDQDDSNQDN